MSGVVNIEHARAKRRRDDPEPKRWYVEATYRTETGTIVRYATIEELDELFRWVEGGPDWTTLIDIRIELHGRPFPDRVLTEHWADLCVDVFGGFRR